MIENACFALALLVAGGFIFNYALKPLWAKAVNFYTGHYSEKQSALRLSATLMLAAVPPTVGFIVYVCNAQLTPIQSSLSAAGIAFFATIVVISFVIFCRNAEGR